MENLGYAPNNSNLMVHKLLIFSLKIPYSRPILVFRQNWTNSHYSVEICRSISPDKGGKSASWSYNILI